MLYDAKTPTEYLEQLEPDWRKGKLLALRQIISERAPHLTEDINYKMLGYRQGEDFVMHLNAQKGYVSLYVGNVQKVDPDGSLLKGIKLGKGCLRFKKSVALADTGIEEFLDRFVSLLNRGVDTGCD